MANLSSARLKAQSAAYLQQEGPRLTKLVLIYTGLSVVLSLAVNGLNLFLNQQIGTTGGLGGLGMRSVLQTAQTLLSYFNTLYVPFWYAGFLFATIRAARNQSPEPRDLLQGFRHFGSILSFFLWELLITMGIGFVLVYPSSFLFLTTPSGQEFTEILLPFLESGELLLADGTINMEALPMDALGSTMLPMFLIYGILAGSAIVFVSYLLRMGVFLLVEGPYRSAFATMLVSGKMMKGHKRQMLKLDLSFWWYYAAEAVLVVILYLDVILPFLGVQLPVSQTAAYFLVLVVYGILELALHAWKKPYVDLTYAMAYDEIYQEFAAEHLKQPE